MGETEVHHRVPRHLLAAFDRMEAHDELDGEGIGLALEFQELAMEYGVADAASITRSELTASIGVSAAELTREEHRDVHTGDFARCGRRGGRHTLALYGPPWFSLMALRRWGKVGDGTLAASLAAMRAKSGRS